MNKFVLLPEAKHRQAMEAVNASTALTAANNNRDVLQSIEQPEQREMLKRYRLARNTLHDSGTDHVDEAKMSEYREAINEFSRLRDRRGGVTLAQPPRPSSNVSNGNNNKGDSKDDARSMDEKDAIAVDVLPVNQRANAKRLMRLLRAHGDDVVSWTPNGEVSIRGQRLRGTNIVDLVGDVLRSPRSLKNVTPQHNQFLAALADANIPETVIKNNAALKRYRAIKSGESAVATSRDNEDELNDSTDSHTISSTTMPEMQFRERDEDDDDDDDDNESPMTKKKRTDERVSTIEWTTTR